MEMRCAGSVDPSPLRVNLAYDNVRYRWNVTLRPRICTLLLIWAEAGAGAGSNENREGGNPRDFPPTMKGGRKLSA
jgi:hypothetical protein